MNRNEYSPLLQWVGRSLKLFALALLGFAIACTLPALLGAPDIAQILVSSVGRWLWWLAVFTFVFLAIAVVVESMRS